MQTMPVRIAIPWTVAASTWKTSSAKTSQRKPITTKNHQTSAAWSLPPTLPTARALT